MRLAFVGLLAAFTLLAQGPNFGPLKPEQQPDLASLSRTVQILRSRAQLGPDVAARVEKLVADAASARDAKDNGAARRDLAEAQALIAGQDWSDRDAFVWSLALELDEPVTEASAPLSGWLEQYYSESYKPKSKLRLNLSLAPREGPARDLGSFDIPASGELEFEASLKGVADGYYRVIARVTEGKERLLELTKTIAVAEGILSRKIGVEGRLARIEGHDSAKATVIWPYDVARVVNEGNRELDTDDFGLGVDGTRDFQFAKEMRESEELLTALEAGEDPLTRAKGDHERHYWFDDGGEIMPYRVYVPSTWDGKAQLPMVFVLHGNTRDHDFYFDRDEGTLWKMAEKHGYLVATTMGYRPSAGYNAAAQRKSNETPRFPVSAKQQRETELSEKDAMNAFKLIVDEYNPDPSRIYLFGHSSGATGGWYFGEKYNDKWAGVALSAFTTRPQDVAFDVFKNTPLMMIVGTEDGARRVEMVKEMVQAIGDHGLKTEFALIEGANHDTIVGLVLPQVFEFFDKQAGK
jgi:poly(3-hydroxybutyrate) depolymerase